jgi:RNA polymerase sigma factor (sigma-70 family)
VRKNSVALVNTSRSTSDNRANESSTNSESSISTVHILERAQRGDRAALHALIDRAMPPVRRWARGRLPQYARQDANTEDVVQDAVLGTIKNIKRLRRVTLGGVQAYLRQSVVNRIRDLIRGKKRRGIVIELDENLPDNRLSPLEAAIRRERHDRFLDALRRLSPTDRQVIVWRLELGYSVEEIAPRLGKSNAAAGMTVTRAVARLAKQLGLARS